MHCKCYIIAPDRILLSVVAGAVLGLYQRGVVEKGGGSGVTKEAQDVESGKGGSSAMGRVPADVEEWLGVERGGPGEGAGKVSSRTLRR